MRTLYYSRVRAASLALVAGLLSGCSKQQEAPPPNPPLPVVCDQVKGADFPIFIRGFGSLTPFNNVDVKARITGKVVAASFAEGAEVKAGDVLFVIDKRPFQANLENSIGVLGQDKANLKYDQYIVDSNRELAKRSIISSQQFEQYKSVVAATESKIVSDMAQVELARIDLSYCDIVAPVSGVTGKRQVDPGNLIIANNGPTLVNIKTLDPIYADFTVPEKVFYRIREATRGGTLKVEINPRGTDKTFEGTLSLVDNAVDSATGTLSLRATFANKDRELWPGQYVTVKLILGVIKNAILVPDGAIQNGQGGVQYVYAARNGKAEMVPIVTGQSDNDFTVVQSGDLKVGEKVITAGVLLLSPGAPVMEAAAMAAAMAAKAQAQAAGAAKPSAAKPPEASGKEASKDQPSR